MSVDILMIASNIVHAQRLEAVLAPLHMQLRRQIGPVFNFTSLFANPPQLVIVDVTAAGPDDPPLELLAELRRHPSSDGVPRLAWGLDLGNRHAWPPCARARMRCLTKPHPTPIFLRGSAICYARGGPVTIWG